METHVGAMNFGCEGDFVFVRLEKMEKVGGKKATPLVLQKINYLSYSCLKWYLEDSLPPCF